MEETGEDKSASTITLAGILLFLNILNWAIVLRDLYSSFRCILHMFICLLHHAWKIWATYREAPCQKLCNCSDENVDDKKREEEKMVRKDAAAYSTQKLLLCENVDDYKLSVGEVKTVMEKLCDPDDENYEETHEIASLFEEDQPSPEELEEAFEMFDQNRDGFIDAGELGKVLCSLGLMERPLEVVECQRMIKVFDDNGDGRIDFKEFVQLVEHSFC
jgi:calmodulin